MHAGSDLPALSLTGQALLISFLALGLLRGVASALQATSLAIYVQSKVGPELAGRANSLHTVIYGASMLSAPLLGNAFFRHASFTMTFTVTSASHASSPAREWRTSRPRG